MYTYMWVYMYMLFVYIHIYIYIYIYTYIHTHTRQKHPDAPDRTTRMRHRTCDYVPQSSILTLIQRHVCMYDMYSGNISVGII